MSLIHITLRKNLECIKKIGLQPGKSINSLASGPDRDKISFFKGVNLDDKKLVEKLLRVLVQGKNEPPFKIRLKKYTIEDFIIVEFIGNIEDYRWSTQKMIELYKMPTMQKIIKQEDLMKIHDEYYRTMTPIPPEELRFITETSLYISG